MLCRQKMAALNAGTALPYYILSRIRKSAVRRKNIFAARHTYAFKVILPYAGDDVLYIPDRACELRNVVVVAAVDFDESGARKAFADKRFEEFFEIKGALAGQAHFAFGIYIGEVNVGD